MLFWNDHTTSDIAWNIAADEALLIACEQDLLGHESALRIWRQRSWAVVMGASGRYMDEVYVDRCQQRGVPIARRSSGGGTVLLGPGTLCVSWVRPLADFKMADRGVRELQVSILQELADQFKAVSPDLEVVASGDWSIHGRKCVGSAQRRLKTHAMVHFSLLPAAASENAGVSGVANSQPVFDQLSGRSCRVLHQAGELFFQLIRNF